MERRFYESGTIRRTAVRVILAWTVLAVTMLPTGCGRTDPKPVAAPTLEPKKLDAAIRAIDSYLAADKPSEAVFVAEKLASEAPGLMRAQEIHGRALVALAMQPDLPSQDRADVMARAADAYDRAAALAPTNAALQHAAGVISDTAMRHPQAVAHYEAAFAADPSSAQYALYLGMAKARDGEAIEARRLLEAAERAMPESPDPKAALADLELRGGDPQAARIKIAQARALAPTSIELRIADARMRRMAGAPRESLELLLALDPPVRREPACAQEIAAAYVALGQVREAAGTLDDSAAAAPNDWKRALRAASAWMQAGDQVRAMISADAAGLAGAPADEVRAALSATSDRHPGG
jgi:tetratricopeptide (TPR) repeat protein